jgi:hypothetical protein
MNNNIHVASNHGPDLPAGWNVAGVADFNGDGLMDMAAITAPNTVTVSLANPGGGSTVCAVLTTPSNRPITDVQVYDKNGDGKQDVIATGNVGNNRYIHDWLGDGDGTFGPRSTVNFHFNPNSFKGF